MHLFRHLLLRAALAVTLLCGGAPAFATPTYFVTIDTAALAGQTGYLDFLFLGLDGAAAAEARVAQLSGDFTGADFFVGAATGTPASNLVLNNGGGWNEAGLGVRFGGLLRFALAFDFANRPDTGTTLSIALLDPQLYNLGGAGDIASFALQPGQAVDVWLDPAFATLAAQAVPEPSAAWLAGIGLLFMLHRTRRRV